MMAVSPLRAAWLLACLRLRRLANLTLTMRFRAKPKQTNRTATPARRRLGGVFTVVMVAAMLFSAVNMARVSVLNMHCGLTAESQCAAGDNSHLEAEEIASDEIQADGLSEPLARAITLQLSLLLMVSFLTPLGSREIASPDWDMEWLVTLPVKRTALLAARVAERSVANPVGWFMLMPPCLITAWYTGFRWSAPLIGIAATLTLLPIAAVLRTIADTGLRMTLSPAKLRNLQALCSLASLPFMYLAISFGMPSGAAFIRKLGPGLPEWMMWTPPGLAIRTITARSMADAALLLLVVVACVAAGIWAVGRQLRNGVVATGAREAARTAPRQRISTARTASWQRLLPRSAVQRRELRLLARDRNFLVQSLLMPVVIVGGQIILNGQLDAIGRMAANPTTLALTAWGIGAYMLMLSAFQTLNNEGQALWMLYTYPTSIDDVLKDKAKLWGVLALVYPAALLVFGVSTAHSIDLRVATNFAIVVAGIPVFSAIAVALGVFACDPLAQDVRTRVRPSYIYLYMLLASMYGYAIYAEKWFQALVVMVLTAGLAQALWQKARDALPYLLDPSAAPPARVSTADGMMAAMLFFVLQALSFMLYTRRGDMEQGPALLLAFLTSGAIVYALVRFVYWRSKTAGVPALAAAKPLRSVAWGLGVGLAAACVGLGYLYLVRATPWFAELAGTGEQARIEARWLLLLAVVLAPLFEEFIFRGLVFGGLRRSIGLAPAMVLSAALFAIVHPPISMLPVFVLGLGTAWVYDRSKGLLAPMLAHAVYNAIVLGSQM